MILPALRQLAGSLSSTCSPSAETANAVANINYVYGMSSTEPQSYVPGWVWLMGLMTLLPVVMFAPVHVLLGKLYGARAQ
jgi:hypothetical protein